MRTVTDRPLILVSNDDGWQSPGIQRVAEALAELGDVWVVAPERERSAVSHAISLHKPLRVRRMADQSFWCSGTPADCVLVAMHHVLPRRPDLCVSGINKGANLGDDVTYSGTVGAAIEAALGDVPAIAASLTGDVAKPDWQPAVDLTMQVARDVLANGLPPHTVLNLNVPNHYDAAKGIRVGRLGRRKYGGEGGDIVAGRDPRGRTYLWLGGAVPIHEPRVPGSDCDLNDEGFASLTPLNLDLTHHALMDRVAAWPSVTSATTDENS